jgi:hypothetical protein
MPPLHEQAFTLILLAIPVACIAWTVTHEEVFREPRDYCVKNSKTRRHVLGRKFFYLFTCEYCFSHYVSAAAVALTGFQMLYGDWRGYVVAGFSLVWIANVYMSLFGHLRLEIREERLEIELEEEEKSSNHRHAGWRK